MKLSNLSLSVFIILLFSVVLPPLLCLAEIDAQFTCGKVCRESSNYDFLLCDANGNPILQVDNGFSQWDINVTGPKQQLYIKYWFESYPSDGEPRFKEFLSIYPKEEGDSSVSSSSYISDEGGEYLARLEVYKSVIVDGKEPDIDITYSFSADKSTDFECTISQTLPPTIAPTASPSSSSSSVRGIVTTSYATSIIGLLIGFWFLQ